MKKNPLKILESLGQSIWLDYIRRDLMAGDQLGRLIENDGVRGMTSNPSIFEKAIAESTIYDNDIHALAITTSDINAIYEALTQQDVQVAADQFRPLYDRTSGSDGYVSLEVNPHLAYDTLGTIEEGSRLWSALNRPNVLIKVPATSEGIPAIRHLVSKGINVNVTLLFSLSRYHQVAEAYIAGISDLVQQGKSPKMVVSVASFFLSRIDTAIDSKVEEIIANGGVAAQTAKKISGATAVSSAKLAYQIYREVFGSAKFLPLGASPQRLLWASTSPKNPAFGPLKYMEALIGDNTVTTIPMETLAAYREGGKPLPMLESNMEEAANVISCIHEAGIDLKLVTDQLEADGVEKFIMAYDKLLAVLSKKIMSC
jgi:transaldolase